MEEKLTRAQQNALHKYFRDVADALNSAGIEVKTFIKVEIPFTAEIVKDHIWRPIQEIYLGKQSTKELNKKKDIDAVYEILNRGLGEKGIHVPFPSEESMLENLKIEEQN